MRIFSILGATGSVGEQTLELIGSLPPETVKLETLVAGKNWQRLAELAAIYKPSSVAIADEQAYDDLKNAVSSDIHVYAGKAGVIEAASQKADWCMAAITGMNGLETTLAAIRSASVVSFASKEMLVAASAQVMAEVASNNTTLLPVDSEHNALFQVFAEHQRAGISGLAITASGGAFRDLPLTALSGVTKAQALTHPTWSMGPKVTIDSATMMNKALEVIEAHYLFDMPHQDITVLLHPESRVHGMVSYVDGSILAHIGPSDMRTAIAHTLAWPQRMKTTGKVLDMNALAHLTFSPLDNVRFPAVSMARACLDKGQAACIAFNAANELAIEWFLNDALTFAQIVPFVERILNDMDLSVRIETLSDVLVFDTQVRLFAQQNLKRIAA